MVWKDIDSNVGKESGIDFGEGTSRGCERPSTESSMGDLLVKMSSIEKILDEVLQYVKQNRMSHSRKKKDVVQELVINKENEDVMIEDAGAKPNLIALGDKSTAVCEILVPAADDDATEVPESIIDVNAVEIPEPASKVKKTTEVLESFVEDKKATTVSKQNVNY
ncbi:hypothetical protein K7X08_032342 [Anisodus acutangulus]|uniref:Uncharacterized protein n=1 Tax=Anisodus acutangulus TaxID=402998 RepID=A0A9Q1M064_9SOLA|nr:hypothetical protein K7X08_032342 [Anisodus acutangulus]